MSLSLTSALGAAGNALDVIQSALGVVQSNVSNSTTPGYASQSISLQTNPVDTVSGMGGGVSNGGVISSRDPYADAAVEFQLQSLGRYTAQLNGTNTLQGFFDVTGATGVSTALTSLFSAFSAWSGAPTSAAEQQAVMSAASGVASSINGLSASLTKTSAQMGTQVNSTVTQINSLAQQIQQYNVARQASGGQTDPGSEAQLQTNLESLSNLVNFTALTQSDGTVTVLVGNGTTPLVMGSQQFQLGSTQSVVDTPPATNPGSPPTSQVLDSQGNDITGSLTGGQLGGELDTQNRVLAGIIGDSQNVGSLNTLARGLADTVNTVLASGTVTTTSGAAGAPLFSYSTGDPTDIAATLQVATGMTGAQLAPVDSSGNSNGNAIALAALANATGAGTGTINGQSFTQYFASIAAGVGYENQTAQSNQTAQQSVVTQAQSLRESISGVSVNAQAALLLQFQHAFQAVSQVLQVVNQMASDILQIVPVQ